MKQMKSENQVNKLKILRASRSIKLTPSFLRSKIEEYEEIRKQIRELSTELKGHGIVEISAHKSLDA